MGFKNGTALLTSDELRSPISWGLMRPVILLNDEALAASGEAEAIIAHELAHVARLDWAKLMLARVRPRYSGSIRWPGCWRAKRTSCARKPPTMRCSPPTSTTPIMPSCWSAWRATNAGPAARRAWRLAGQEFAPPPGQPRARRRLARGRAAGGRASPRDSPPPACRCPSPRSTSCRPRRSALPRSIASAAARPRLIIRLRRLWCPSPRASLRRRDPPHPPVRRPALRYADDDVDVDVDVDVDPVVDVDFGCSGPQSARAAGRCRPRPPRTFEQVVAMRAVGASPAVCRRTAATPRPIFASTMTMCSPWPRSGSRPTMSGPWPQPAFATSAAAI